jgi:hypothetical protein
MVCVKFMGSARFTAIAKKGVQQFTLSAIILSAIIRHRFMLVPLAYVDVDFGGVDRDIGG